MIRPHFISPRPLTALLIGIALAFSLAACSDSSVDSNDDDLDVSPESFSISIEGDGIDNRTLSGVSTFASGTSPETGESAFLVFLTDTANFEEASTLGFFGRATTRPGTGSYRFADLNFDDDDEVDEGELREDEFVFLLWDFSGSAFSLYTSTSGDLSITTSSSNRVAGAFDISGSLLRFDFGQEEEPEPVTIALNGEFDASERDFVDLDFFDPDF